MARIAGVDLPKDKRVEAGLTYIYGIGQSKAKEIITATGVNPDIRVKDLNEDDVAKTVTEAGYDPYEKSILGITAMSKLLGKKKFDELLGSLTFKPPGKPTLVSKSDKRPVMKNTAQEDFKE